ncbi:sigma-70 family RNA polymerase sigma factor [Chitinophaga oryzae]|uniref:Sigma-70 family RNA polymerase sigma factor n=1 Tax=Chitinophaga oryzae TaxID=2725414 RepID=A0AAE7D7A8_9BACT|nr:sigma-70 family RNA polymerase sigma factor [Chitinophaga oryzae]QJB32056.1 sigma-70 family RNA polymerase sigma factor [Chitinophaga oryzae]QJB38533.1 sigma-70 family RNA polymerase sigma factor [Chitinophaga oryzae]
MNNEPVTFRNQHAAGQPQADTANTLLWEEVRQNNQEALVALYEKMYLSLVNYGIRSCGDAELAKDAINDVFLEIWDKRHQLTTVRNVKSYLFTYLRRKIFAGIRQSQQTGAAVDAFATAAPYELSYEARIVAVQTTEELRRKVRRAIAQLTPRQQQLVELRYFDGLPMEEVARRTGITTKTAYNTLGSALKILSAAFSLLILLHIKSLRTLPAQETTVSVHKRGSLTGPFAVNLYLNMVNTLK